MDPVAPTPNPPQPPLAPPPALEPQTTRERIIASQEAGEPEWRRIPLLATFLAFALVAIVAYAGMGLVTMGVTLTDWLRRGCKRVMWWGLVECIPPSFLESFTRNGLPDACAVRSDDLREVRQAIYLSVDEFRDCMGGLSEDALLGDGRVWVSELTADLLDRWETTLRWMLTDEDGNALPKDEREEILRWIRETVRHAHSEGGPARVIWMVEDRYVPDEDRFDYDDDGSEDQDDEGNEEEAG